MPDGSDAIALRAARRLRMLDRMLGVLLLFVGFVLMAAALFFCLTGGTELPRAHSAGYLMIAIGGYLLAAAGKDIRVRASKARSDS